MSAAKDWARFLAVAAAYVVAFVLVRRAVSFSLESPWFVVTAMVCVLGLAFLARPLVPFRMPRGARRVRGWEARVLYRRLGVPAFGSLLRNTPLRFLNTDVYLAAGARSPRELAVRLEEAEASHFWAALLVAPYMIRLLLQGACAALFWIAVAQVLLNLYPIMHLRLTRYRLERVASRASRQR